MQTVDFFPPLVDDPFVYGQIAAANALSDVYAMGGDPLTALNLVCFPDDQLPLDVLGDILRGGAERAAAAGCVIVGGHTVRDTEIKYGMAVTGLVHPQRIFTNAGARPGDVLILTKPLGTGFVTTAHKRQDCSQEVLQQACASMIQLNRGASLAMREIGAHACTDITGFGLAGHALEMALASKVTLAIDVPRLPLLPGVEEFVAKRYFTRARKTNSAFVADHLLVQGVPDPVRLEVFYDAQTSGGLLIAAPQATGEALVRRARALGASAACVVGEVLPAGDKALILRC